MVNDGSKNLPKIGLRSNQTTCKCFLNEFIRLAGTRLATALVDQRHCTSVSHSVSVDGPGAPPGRLGGGFRVALKTTWVSRTPRSCLEGSPKPPRSRFEQGAFEAPQDLPSGDVEPPASVRRLQVASMNDLKASRCVRGVAQNQKNSTAISGGQGEAAIASSDSQAGFCQQRTPPSDNLC
ncbi:hypothetical protein H4Q26_014445 [Puccinia striiformis f. sp. tritici PST-130]|nr:hypothetical protein H4Q26_014445 [Puccinia striiformis f. sp. tritici PST-130]